MKYVVTAIVGAILMAVMSLIAPHAWWVLPLALGIIGMFAGPFIAFMLALVGFVLGGIITLFGEAIMATIGFWGFPLSGAILGIIVVDIFGSKPK